MRHAGASNRGPQRQNRSPHGLHQFIRRNRVVHRFCFDGVAFGGNLLHGNVRRHERQQLAHRNDVADLGNVVQRPPLRGFQPRRPPPPSRAFFPPHSPPPPPPP